VRDVWCGVRGTRILVVAELSPILRALVFRTRLADLLSRCRYMLVDRLSRNPEPFGNLGNWQSIFHFEGDAIELSFRQPSSIEIVRQIHLFLG
jgi:hypothetical protein